MAGVAAAQPAPITYAGNGELPPQTQSATVGLAGGGDNSYGYGARGNRQRGQREAAVIDIRRPANDAPRSQPVALTTSEPSPEPVRAELQQRTEQGSAPGWLEREQVGPPYEANGRWYVPTPEPGYEQTGTASWYGPTFHGQRTASGEVYDQEGLTAAHPTLPIPSLVQVTNLENGREVIVRVNDRGPFVGERLIDMSRGGAVALGFEEQGRARVHVRYLGPAPRRVNGAGESVATPSPAPSLSVREAPSYVQATPVEEGPVSLRPPSSDDLAGGPDMEERPVYRASAPAPAVAPASGLYVQVGAFSDLANAHRVRDQVRRAGPVVVDVRQTAAGELFRVRIGPLASQDDVDDAREELAALGYAQTIVASR